MNTHIKNNQLWIKDSKNLKVGCIVTIVYKRMLRQRYIKDSLEIILTFHNSKMENFFRKKNELYDAKLKDIDII